LLTSDHSYTPSFVLCIVALVLFDIALALHVYQFVRHRSWYFIPFAVGCLMEVIGYAFRMLSAKRNPYNVNYFVVQYFFIVTAPVFFSASIYVCLSRLIHWSRSEGYVSRAWYLKPKAILWLFISADVITTIMQIAGAALVGVSQSKKGETSLTPDVGNNILLAGLAIQTAAFTLYLILYIMFTISIYKDPRFGRNFGGKKWFFLGLFAASLLVYLRTIFRLAETAEGLLESLSTIEGYFIGLEFVPIVLAVFLLNVWHPGRYLPNDPRRIKSNIEMGNTHHTI
jgi:hypothetical protein